MNEEEGEGLGMRLYQRSHQHTQGVLIQYYANFSLTWKWDRGKTFDMVVCSTQNMRSQFTLPFAWGGHCYTYGLLTYTLSKYSTD